MVKWQHIQYNTAPSSLLKAMDGVTSVEVSLENKNATVELSKDISDAEFKAVIDDAGYELKSVQ